MVKNHVFVCLSVQAYLPVEHRGFIDNSGDLSCLVKIPYRIFVGGIAFNVSLNVIYYSSMSCRWECLCGYFLESFRDIIIKDEACL